MKYLWFYTPRDLVLVSVEYWGSPVTSSGRVIVGGGGRKGGGGGGRKGGEE